MNMPSDPSTHRLIRLLKRASHESCSLCSVNAHRPWPLPIMSAIENGGDGLTRFSLGKFRMKQSSIRLLQRLD